MSLLFIILCGQGSGTELELFENNTENQNIVVEEKKKIIVHVTGCVEKEGIVELDEGARIADAIEEAGSATLDADMSRVNLAYKLKDGQKLYIPSNIDSEEKEVVTDKGEGVLEESGSIGGKININTATQTELETLSGIGPSMALKIIDYRTNNGDFSSIEDIKNVPGIGEAKFESIQESICTD